MTDSNNTAAAPIKIIKASTLRAERLARLARDARPTRKGECFAAPGLLGEAKILGYRVA